MMLAAPTSWTAMAVVLIGLALSPAAAAQNPPKDIEAEAPSETSILLTWFDDSSNEDGFRIERDGSIIDTVGMDVMSYTDTGLNPGQTYVYRVGSYQGGGAPAWSLKAWALPTEQKEFWPMASSVNGQTVGFTYGEYFQDYWTSPHQTDYHTGVDTMYGGVPLSEAVYAPFSGRLFSVRDVAGSNAGVELVINNEYLSLGHIQNLRVTDADEGGWVMAGVQLADVFSGTFGAYGSHVHEDRLLRPFVTADRALDSRHFLKMYTEDKFRDPQSNKPEVKDRKKPSDLDSDDESVQYRDDAGGAYFTTKTGDTPPDPQPPEAFILHGKVDIIAEGGDDMGHMEKPAAWYKAGYWVQSKACYGNDVRDSEKPYVLHECSPHLFDGTTQETPDIYETSKATSWIPDWGNDTCPFWTLTNTKGTDGKMSNVDKAQHWATNAKKGSGGQPNGVDKGTATKAEDAHFGDGGYDVHVLSWDLVHESDDIDQVWLENFPPAVVSMELDDDCHVNIGFSESMNWQSVEQAITWVDVETGQELNFSVEWFDMFCRAHVSVEGLLENAEYKVKVDASIAKDISGGPSGDGAFLDSQFGESAHNGTSEGDPTDSVCITFECSSCQLWLGLEGTDGLLMPGQDQILVNRVRYRSEVLEGEVPAIRIPNDPWLTGLKVYAQVYMRNAFDFPDDPIKVSNGLEITLGSDELPVPYGSSSAIQLWGEESTPIGGRIRLDFRIQY